MHRAKLLLLGLLLGGAIAVISAASAIYAGLYNVAADLPHTQTVYWLLQQTRDRSIARRARDVIVPDNLADTKRISSGAGQYAEMCASCHLAPGMKRTEISRGLYPRAPELRRDRDLSPAQKFWVVKHGIKMTGMPAWGLTHSDDLLWDIVAFLEKLPDLTPEQYRSVLEEAPCHDAIMEGGKDSDHDRSAHH